MEYHSRAWTMNQTVKRSRNIRWFLLVYVAVLVGLMIGCLTGIFNNTSSFGITGVITFFTVLLMNQSPFQPTPLKSKWAQGGIRHLPDEFEIQAFQSAQSKAFVPIGLTILVVFFWLGWSSERAWVHPQGLTSWLILGWSLAFFAMILPSTIAEWSVPFPENDTDVEDDQ